MSTTQQYKSNRIRDVFDHRHGAGSFEASYKPDADPAAVKAREEFIAGWAAGYEIGLHWEGVRRQTESMRRQEMAHAED